VALYSLISLHHYNYIICYAAVLIDRISLDVVPVRPSLCALRAPSWKQKGTEKPKRFPEQQ